MCRWPQALAITCISSVEAWKKLLSRWAEASTTSRAQVGLLRGDAHRAGVGVAGAHAEAGVRLDGSIGDRDGVGAER